MTVEALSQAVIDELAVFVGEDNLLTSQADCIAYGYDNSKLQAIPQAVILADDTEQLEKVVALCYEHQIPLIARGRGTGTTGATVPVQGGIVLSFERMNGILEIDPDNRIARVQPGVINQTLQDELARQGFFWPPDPTSAANCTIGGNLAYNSAGPRAIKYGTPRENTLALTAIDGTGRKFSSGVKTTKGVVGYDLTRLLIGSEGTLAIITEATLKLTPLAQQKRTMQARFNSVHAAAQAVSAIMSQPETPCALEIMDEAAINMVKQFSDLGLDDNIKAILMIEADGNTHSLPQSVAAIESACQNAGLVSFEIANDQETVERLWKTRKALSPALRNIAPKKINEDVVVPVSRIPELIEGLQQIASEYQIQIVNFGHAGNGNIHVNMLLDTQNPVHAKNSDACLKAIFKLVLKLQGTLSGEHGIGLVKRDYIDMELDQHSLKLMRQIKQQFDPGNILNPGKTLPEI
jgi:D-lactate dehydrogenase